MISPPRSIYPSRYEWPIISRDLATVPRNATKVKLVIKAVGYELLREFESLESLWCYGIDQRKLEQIVSRVSLRELYLDWYLRITDVGPLKKLTQLKVLRFDSCSNIKSLEQVGELDNLVGLAIENFKNVHNIKPLSNLTNLKDLAVEGSIWTRMKIESLAPLTNLTTLEFLGLTSLKVLDESLEPLANLKNLKRLNLANAYPFEEFARLAARLPGTECQWFVPYISTTLTCQNCKSANRVILTGKGKSHLCPHCNEKRLGQHVEAFELVKANTPKE
jgi:hypothetical protein